MAKRVWPWIREYAFTLLLLVALLAGAFITETTTGVLTAAWLRRVGFAPRDFWNLDLARMFTSALVTHGPRVLSIAVLMTGFSVGLVESRAGWRRAAGVFWGVHLLTLVVLSVILSPIHTALRTRATETVFAVRDVGPSAGYFGALGFGLPRSGWRHRTLIAASIAGWLALAALVSPGGEAAPLRFSANLAHLIAFPVGWLWGARCWLWRRPETQEPD
jgi:hypothetical protein